mmetsp:Transcript_28138/g.24871  ORF Transcript_28138/g.24871 Transcript_28138/m.24871 type:complete len:173 (+) Transcript_28138:17-535(+)
MSSSSQIVTKWIGVPSSILAIVVATSSLNLCYYWKTILKDQKFDYLNYRNDSVLFALLLGLLGSTTGFIIYRVGNTLSYLNAALFALIGYVGLAVCSSFTYSSEWIFFFTLIFLVITGISAGIAIVAATCTPVENFTRRGAIIMIILLIGYFLIGYMFEFSLRNGMFPKTKN